MLNTISIFAKPECLIFWVANDYAKICVQAGGEKKNQLLVDMESFITRGVKAGEWCIIFYKECNE